MPPLPEVMHAWLGRLPPHCQPPTKKSVYHRDLQAGQHHAGADRDSEVPGRERWKLLVLALPRWHRPTMQRRTGSAEDVDGRGDGYTTLHGARAVQGGVQIDDLKPTCTRSV